jgi:hypothetical protein
MKQRFSFGIRAIQGIAHKIAPAHSGKGFKGSAGLYSKPNSQRHIAHRKGEGDDLNNYARVRGLAIVRHSASK